MKTIAALTVAMFAVMTFVIARVVIAIHVWLYVAAILMSGAWGAFKTWQVIKMGSAARQYIPLAIKVKARWRYVSRHLGLSYQDPHAKRKSRRPFGPSIGNGVRIEVQKSKISYPRIKVRPDSHGIVVQIETVPRGTRKDYEDCAENLANYWRCARVGVSQTAPGKLLLRGIRNDPLLVPFGMSDVPSGVYDKFDPRHVFVGRDEWTDDRFIDLNGVTGITIVGLPGFGKTSLTLSLLCQLAITGAVQFVIIDGKGSHDYTPWIPRAWMHTGDDLESAVDVLEKVHDLMRERNANIIELTGSANGWRQGPTPEFPLVIVIVDEAHTFYDLDGIKGQKQQEQYANRCRYLTGQLIKKGRSSLFCTVMITQKSSGSAIPTDLRDLCQLGFSFACTTTAAAVMGLGEGIKEYPSYMPTLLRDPSMIGVCVGTLPTGQDPFAKMRVPEIPEQAAADRAKATAACRRDPTQLVQVPSMNGKVPV